MTGFVSSHNRFRQMTVMLARRLALCVKHGVDRHEFSRLTRAAGVQGRAHAGSKNHAEDSAPPKITATFVPTATSINMIISMY